MNPDAFYFVSLNNAGSDPQIDFMTQSLENNQPTRLKQNRKTKT